MKRFAPYVLLMTLFAMILVPVALAAAAPAPAPKVDKSPIAPIAGAITTVTGIAISPLLGTAGYGAYQWSTADDAAARAKLPWYAQISFWLPALLVVGACAAKDSLGTVLPPGAKKPLDVLETIENKASGLVAAGAVVPFTMDFLTKAVLSKSAEWSAAPAPAGLAMIPFAAVDLTWLLNLLTVPFGVAMFVIVWMASHAINVLILLSPWGAIDAALKSARTAVLGLLVVSSTINPWIGAVLSLVVIVIAYFVAGWAFRLTVFGSIFSWDFLTRRSNRFTPPENDNKLFAGPQLAGVPVRTYGRLVQRTEGGLEFMYRPWLILGPRSVKVTAAPATLAVGKGLFFSDIVTDAGATLFSLPPRYRGHEETIVRAYLMGGGVRDAGLRKAWSALRNMLGGSSAEKAAAPA